MKHLLFVFSLIFAAFIVPSALQADQKVIYISYYDEDNIPERVFNGEYFSIQIKTLSTIRQHKKLKYSFKGGRGARIQNHVPYRRDKGSYVIDTFYFMATSSNITLPNITASIGSNHSTLSGVKITGVTLNPDKKFSGILADDFKITTIDAKKYDNKHNIITFEAKAKHCNIKKFHLNVANEQGFERSKVGINASSMTYYAVIPKKYDKLEFTYFNLKKERYVKLKMPIEVVDDSVSTQSDLKPTESKHHLIKIALAAAIIVIAIILLIVYRKWWIAIFIIAPGIFIALQATPAKMVCVNANAPLYLLPIENATVFEVLSTQGEFEVKHSVKDFKQITHNKKIGWISEDDICAN